MNKKPVRCTVTKKQKNTLCALCIQMHVNEHECICLLIYMYTCRCIH